MIIRVGFGLIGFLIIEATIFIGVTADTHNVGDSLGWTVPPPGNDTYKTWAAKEHFKVGDTLVFRWNHTHSVAEVSKFDYENCDRTNENSKLQNTSPATFTLNSTGPHYFICSVGRHCNMGQKLAITVESSASSLATTSSSAVVLAMVIYISTLM